MEILDVVDENGIPTGKTVDRITAHKKGIRHRTSHVWIARQRAGRTELLLQKRSENKDSHPGCLDISSAGHIPAGCTYLESAVRELSEELGINVSINDLHFCGKKRKAYKKNFHEEEFFDNQVSNVYVMFSNLDETRIRYQESEISGVLWMPLDDIIEMVAADEAMLGTDKAVIDDNRKVNKSCIAMEEILMVKSFIIDHPEYFRESY